MEFARKKFRGELRDKTREELLKIAKKLRIGNPDRLSSSELRRRINDLVTKKAYVKNAVWIPLDSPQQSECVKQLNRWVLRSEISTGGFGVVHRVCRKGFRRKCKFIMKVQSLGSQREAFENEVALLKKFGEKGISPKLVEAWECKFRIRLPGARKLINDPQAVLEATTELGYFVMEEWKGDLISLILKQQGLYRSQLEAIIEVIKKLHKEGYVHRDLFLRNIVWRKRRKKLIRPRKSLRQKADNYEFALIDFGLSKRINPVGSEPRDIRPPREAPGVVKSTLVPDYDFWTLKQSLFARHGIETDLLDPYIKEVFEDKPVKGKFQVANKFLIEG